MLTPEQNKEITRYLVAKNLPIDLVLEVVPHQVTLVPDPPDALTSNNGWDTNTHNQFLKDIVQAFHSAGIRTSIFVNPTTSKPSPKIRTLVPTLNFPLLNIRNSTYPQTAPFCDVIFFLIG